jgi:tetratricopeptide (TPR) repeat protein
MEGRIESPLTHVQNPILKEVEAETLERLVASGQLKPAERERKARELAGVLNDLGQREKALATLRALLAQRRAPDAGILNQMALIVDKLGDHEEACRLFEEAADANRDSDAALFNLALRCRDRGKVTEANYAIDRALERDNAGPSHALKALLAKDANDEKQKEASLRAAMTTWPSPRGMNDWMLSWYTIWARESGDDTALTAAERERERRTHAQSTTTVPEGELPVATGSDR